MKIAVVFTGGTISSLPEGDYLSPSQKTKYKLLEALDSNINVESFQPYYILSEQLNGTYLTKLIKCVNKCLEKDFDGVIVTHGTDTLQYSAAALSIAFSSSNIPVVLVSSNYILTDKRANGLINFNYAVKFIKEKIDGVFVSYKSDGSNPEIFTADSLLPHLPFSDRLSAVNGAFGYFKDDRFILKRKDYRPKKSAGTFILSERSPVLWIRAYAGMTYPKTDGFKAILLESYHSGTLPTEDRNFINFCKNSKIPIYISGVENETKYESAKVYDQLNIVVLEKQSPIYAYLSLWKQL